MQLAIIADIHGNLVALDAILAEIAERGVEHIICLGDVAASGPQPREVIARLKQLNCPVVMGNTDAWLLKPEVKERSTAFARRCQDIDLWCAEKLTPEDRAHLESFQPTLALQVDEKKLVAYHGSPRSFHEQLLATTSEEALAEALKGYEADIFVGGHTHAQLLRRHKAALVLNPGSVGLAMDRVWPLDEVRNPPWGEYALLDVQGNRVSVDLRRVPFDIQAFLKITRESGMPHGEWSASEWNLS